MKRFSRSSRRAVWSWRKRLSSTQGAERGSGDLIGASGGGRIVGPCEGSAPGKRRAFELRQGSCDGAAQVIVGVGMAAGKARAAELEDGLNLGGRRAAPEQLFGDPLVGDTPIGVRESLWNAQPVQPGLIDRYCRPSCDRAIGRAERTRSRLAEGREAVSQSALGRFHQPGAVCRQASLGVEQFHPGSVTAGPAAFRFLIGEAGEPSQMAPVGAGGIASIETRQLSANFSGYGRLERSGADVNPGLEITGTGLQHNAGLMPIGAHGVEDLRIGSIQIHQKVAAVAVRGERPEVNVKSLAVASAQEPYSRSHCEQACRPQPFSGARGSTAAMNRTDQVKFVRHRRQLPANSRQGNKKSVIMHGTNFEFKAARRTMDFQRTVSCELTGCLTFGVHCRPITGQGSR
jgi:hypothetical protein